MTWPILASLAGQLAGNVSSQIIQGEENRKAMGYQNTLNMNAVRESPLAHVQGLKQAGLSPALANSQGFSAPSTSALGVNAPQMPNFFQMAEIAQNQQLVNAQVDLLQSETDQKNIYNDRLRDENYTLDANIRGKLIAMAEDDSNPARAYSAQLMLDSNELFSKGTGDALSFWNTYTSEVDTAETQAMLNSFVRNVQRLRNGRNEKYIADMDEAELRKIGAETFHLLAMAKEATTASNVNEKRIDEIAAHIGELIESKDSIYYNNPAKMYKNKDKMGFFGYVATKTIEDLAKGAGFAVGAKGAGLGAKALRAGQVPAKNAKGFNDYFKTGFEGKKVRKRVTPLSQLPMSEQTRRIMSYY